VNTKTPDVDTIFCAAIEIVSPADRVAYIVRVCGGDEDLRRRVQRLVEAHFQAGSFLAEPSYAAGATGPFDPQSPESATAAAPGEGPGTVIGPCKLLEQIGEGGFGVVFMAQQQEPIRRKVALKVLKPGMDSKQVIARFEAERQALALMDHPNIARVFDGGATPSGRPYFIMELVNGVPITEFCDEHHLTPRQRLELFVSVCQAVQHAHQKGIIHRDLKPSNVLVALYDGKPVPKVIDFGIAKAAGQQLTDKTLVTGFGAIVGTLEYMSPEQAEINQLDIDTRSDIYSLGVLLYELLTGSPPFTKKDMEAGGLLETLRVIREQEPTKPSAKLSTAEGLPTLAANRGTEPAKLTRLVRGELDWIVMKALEKDRNRRYETASAFAADVQRYLTDEPVLACPPSAWYRFGKFARRNRTQLALAVALGLLLSAGGAFGWHSDRQATATRVEADRRAARTEREVTAALAELAALLDRGGDEIQNPPRWRLTLDAARSAHRRAGAALEAGPASDELREQVRAAGDRLAVAEADCETAGQCEGWVADFVAGVGRPDRFSVADLRRRAEGLLDRAGVPPAATPLGSRAAAVRGHRLRYQLTVLVLLADQENKIRGKGDGGPIDGLAEELTKDVHPLQRVVREASAGGRLRVVLADGPGRSVTSTELVCLALGLGAASPVNRRVAEVFADEALRRNPADLAAMTLALLGRRTLPTRHLKVVHLADIDWLSPPDPRPPVLDESAVRTIAAAERGLTLRPDLAILWVISARILAGAGHHGEAAERYRQAVRLDPADQFSRVGLAEALTNAGRLGEAVEVYRATLRAFPRITTATSSPIAAGVGSPVRVAAARAALVLAHDAGEATARLGEGERRELRRDALRWLREWLSESPTGLELFLMKRDPAFRPVRDPAARDQFPPDERAEWRDLWEAVRSARDTGLQRYAFKGDPPPPDPREVAPPPREVKP
jgi:cytochrome c-type biogenesis protein CcmH/NrfG